MGDTFDLQRFVEAQAGVFDTAMAELRNGRKQSHWMWFVFPQVAGLGRSPVARHYALSGLDEARAYLSHPVLGARLLKAVGAMNRIEGRSARDVLGSPDDVKFRSCLTLFLRTAPQEPTFGLALRRYFRGEPDRLTIEILEGGA